MLSTFTENIRVAAVYCFLEMSVSKMLVQDDMHTLAGILKAIVKSIMQDASSVTVWNVLFFTALQMSFWQTVMLRCCVDIFIISGSVLLTARFHQVTERIGFLIRKTVRQCLSIMQNIKTYIRIVLYLCVNFYI